MSTYPQSVPHSTILWQCKALFIEKTLSERRQQGNDGEAVCVHCTKLTVSEVLIEPVQKLTANELSAFYKQFLNERYGEQAMYFRWDNICISHIAVYQQHTQVLVSA